jgi:hypothetical protein
MLIVTMCIFPLVYQRSRVPAPSPRKSEPSMRIATAFVTTDDEIVQRLAASSVESRVGLIPDDDLSQWLVDSGLTEGWIRIGKRVILAHDVAPPREAPAFPDGAS